MKTRRLFPELMEGVRAMADQRRSLEPIDDQTIVEAWRVDDHGDLDDVVVPAVACFRMERMDTGKWWIGLYLADGRLIHIDLVRRQRAVLATKRED